MSDTGSDPRSEFQEDTAPAAGLITVNNLVLDLDGFEGPIDLLLTLARDQKVDLAKISILALAEQYLEFINKARELRLELAADYLVMAAWLAYLKSKLLLPPMKRKRKTRLSLLRVWLFSCSGWKRCRAFPRFCLIARAWDRSSLLVACQSG